MTNTLEVINGHTWFYRCAPLSDVFHIDIHDLVWHLWDSDHEYSGNFPSKRKLHCFITEASIATKGD